MFDVCLFVGKNWVFLYTKFLEISLISPKFVSLMKEITDIKENN